ncbi:tellurite resistance/C4-dicarboxylate transporter family protein [Comamonas sp. NLF-1-9]|uniref:tellurite resistance/C4-dicarboxylate transporter family protein n=1 Tax=Comamonas sp. NLF-1-9 TaxID=2853163 RepID=UPI001C443256|nr:tellurite resistance/C4-dicarboxylate transporter family protein [Comamonas sp. NLF-1-9]QXL83217.1 tellurite resistance/C4-dicarboxylate transporter family protein [Comamonas sp. NLF-1-9]
MNTLAAWRAALAELSPANFGLVMATGILALAAGMLGLPWVARVLLVLNVAQYALLWLLYLLRALIWPRRCLGDLTDHARGPGYFTVVAATGVLASQVLVQEQARQAGLALGVLTLVLWAAFTYSIFLAFIIKRDKPPLVQGISGSWLLAVVATQSVAVVCALLAPDVALRWRATLNFLALTLWLWAGVLYLWLMGLIFYRFMFLRLAPEELVPSYWINMGALAISTLAGALLIHEAPQAPWLAMLLPFVKGVTLTYWAAGSWWIPVLVLLGVWRHGVRRYPLVYEPRYWALVFPLGMYAACTWQMDHALQLALLEPLARVFLGFGLLAWLLTFAGLVRRVFRLLPGFGVYRSGT